MHINNIPQRFGESISRSVDSFAVHQEHFTEGADYLRSSGVLDESDPEDPKASDRSRSTGCLADLGDGESENLCKMPGKGVQ